MKTKNNENIPTTFIVVAIIGTALILTIMYNLKEFNNLIKELILMYIITFALISILSVVHYRRLKGKLK